MNTQTAPVDAEVTPIDYRKPFTDRESRIVGSKVTVQVHTEQRQTSMSYRQAMAGSTPDLRAGLGVPTFSGLLDTARSSGQAAMGGTVIRVITTDLSSPGDEGCVCDLPEFPNTCSGKLRLQPDAPRTGEFVRLCDAHEGDYREAALELILSRLSVKSAVNVLSRVYRYHSMARLLDTRTLYMETNPSRLWELVGLEAPTRTRDWTPKWTTLPEEHQRILISTAIQLEGQP